MFDADGETAIERALRRAHPGAAPARFAARPAGKDAIAGCLAARVEEPTPHWLVVSRGFTELGDKLEEDPEISGWGFELTCRLPARSSEAPDLGWIMDWMQRVADDLAARVSFLDPYHHMEIQPAAQGDDVAAIVFVEDVRLEPTRSQNGAFYFLQMVGLTRDEYAALHAWDARGLVDLVRERDPLLLLDRGRASLLADPGFAAAVDEGRERDGSSTGVLYGVALLWLFEGDELRVHLDVDAAAAVRAAMRSRLRHGKAMMLFGDRRKNVRPDGSLALRSQVNLALKPEEGPSEIVSDDDGPTCLLRLGPDAIDELARELPETPGSAALASLPGVSFVVTTRERLREPGYPR
ncbi:MAG: suppressor of fused domain protein [Labilithrix sp.]|nr:suppressor of fused domain protein [Labilithrix sp.]